MSLDRCGSKRELDWLAEAYNCWAVILVVTSPNLHPKGYNLNLMLQY